VSASNVNPRVVHRTVNIPYAPNQMCHACSAGKGSWKAAGWDQGLPYLPDLLRVRLGSPIRRCTFSANSCMRLCPPADDRQPVKGSGRPEHGGARSYSWSRRPGTPERRATISQRAPWYPSVKVQPREIEATYLSQCERSRCIRFWTFWMSSRYTSTRCCRTSGCTAWGCTRFRVLRLSKALERRRRKLHGK
jgi:hypothetical protein